MGVGPVWQEAVAESRGRRTRGLAVVHERMRLLYPGKVEMQSKEDGSRKWRVGSGLGLGCWMDAVGCRHNKGSGIGEKPEG